MSLRSCSGSTSSSSFRLRSAVGVRRSQQTDCRHAPATHGSVYLLGSSATAGRGGLAAVLPLAAGFLPSSLSDSSEEVSSSESLGGSWPAVAGCARQAGQAPICPRAEAGRCVPAGALHPNPPTCPAGLAGFSSSLSSLSLGGSMPALAFWPPAGQHGRRCGQAPARQLPASSSLTAAGALLIDFVVRVFICRPTACTGAASSATPSAPAPAASHRCLDSERGQAAQQAGLTAAIGCFQQKHPQLSPA